MITYLNAGHARHAGQFEMFRGQLVPCYEVPARLDHVLGELRKRPLGAIEPPFYAAMLQALELDPARFAAQMDPSQWPALRAEVAAAVKRRSRDEWTARLEGSDVTHRVSTAG